MARPYNPKTDLYNAPRIQKEFKDILKDINNDRQKAWDAYNYFKNIVDVNPDDDKAKAEMVKCLEIYIGAQNNKMKALDSLIKIRVHLDKTPAPDPKAENLELLSFDELKSKKFN
jgi:hypothetical protein|tara:strand:- start:2303 stop:2647 length:345 start_codon:yes stop_codon:yes gene_type:complete